MASQSRSDIFLVAAVLAPLITAFGSTQLACLTGYYPHVSPLAHVGIGVGVLLGFALFWGIKFRSLPWRLGAMCVYLIIAVVASYAVGFVTACGNGDCI
jgi:hypothetical protein